MSSSTTIDDQYIPRKYYRNQCFYDWENAKGTSVPFSYEDRVGELIMGKLIILDTYKKRGDWMLIVQHGDSEPHTIASYHFTKGKLGSIIGVNTKKHKYYEGQHIKNINDNGRERDITITKVYRSKEKSFTGKFVDYHCNKCGSDIVKKR